MRLRVRGERYLFRCRATLFQFGRAAPKKSHLPRHNPSLIAFALLHCPPSRLQPVLAVLSPSAHARHAGSTSTQRSCTGCRPWLHPHPSRLHPKPTCSPCTQTPYRWTQQLKLSPMVCVPRRESPSKKWANSAAANGGRGAPLQPRSAPPKPRSFAPPRPLNVSKIYKIQRGAVCRPWRGSQPVSLEVGARAHLGRAPVP